jgi:hypothetical protein
MADPGSRIVSAAEALGRVEPGQRVDVQGGCAVPSALDASTPTLSSHNVEGRRIQFRRPFSRKVR